MIKLNKTDKAFTGVMLITLAASVVVLVATTLNS